MDGFFADLHIHSCLSPCADDDMTPANLCGMARLKGLDVIALTDHNAAGNLPAAQAQCDALGLTLLPGMEITTREEVHLLGYFPSVQSALAFGDMLRAHLPAGKNRPDFFGRQLVLDENDEIVREEDALLIGATDLTLSDAAAAVRDFGGVPVPAHINRGSNGLLINLGLMPEAPAFSTVEIWRDLPCDDRALRGRHVLFSSDAHHLGDIREQEDALRLKAGDVSRLLAWMRSPASL